MKRLSNQKRRAGFTLAEILVAVAILTILLALAVPNVLAYYRRLKLAELDDSARAIFMAAQNRMTAMINAGEMEKLTPDGTTDIGSLTVSFLEKGSTGELLPAGSIESDLAGGKYVVEYFPESGAVYAVFFTDQGDFIEDYKAGSYNSLQSRGRTDRLEKKPLVGYYGDSEERQIDRVEVGQLPVPQVTLKNAEELMLDIFLPTIVNPGFDASKIKLEVTLANATSEPKIIVKGKPVNDGPNGTNIHLALDTLKSYSTSPGSMTGDTALTNGLTAGANFKDWVGSSGIQPGDDIKVTVTVSYANGGNVQFLPQTVVVTGNSLFASVDGATAKVAYGRHLQNLDPAVSGVKGDITQAEQISEIDFGKTGGGIESWDDTYGGLVFDPIENAKLASYDGRSLPIRKLNAQNISGSAGLFGDITNSCTLKNIVLIDGKANGTTVGTLAGTAQGVTVENCQVYLESLDKRTESPAVLLSGSTVGGLIGSATSCDISYSFASTVEKGSGTVGGLLGTVSGGAVKNCYAAGYLDGDRVGGLLGDASDGTAASECYAAGIIVGCSSAAAGLCPSDISIANGYAAVRYATDLPRNIIGTTTASSERLPYVRQPGIKYQGYGKPVTTSALMKEGVAGDCWLYAKTADATGKSQNPISAVFPYWQTKETSMLQPPYPYPMLKGKNGPLMFHYGDWLAAESEGFLAYYEKYEDKSFGLHTNYVVAQDTASASFINSLTNDPANPVVEDGYAVVTEGEQSRPSVKIGTTEYDLTSSIGSVVIDGKYYWLFALPEDVLKAPDGTVAVTSYYTKLTIGGNEGEPYYFNPHFACEAFDGKTLVSPTEEQLKTPQPKKGVVLSTSVPGIPDPVTSEKDVLIRTARQLADLAAYTAVPSVGAGVAGTAVCENALTWSYHQLLDIDYTKYTGYALWFSTGKELTPQYPAQLAGGSYNGHEHEISNLYLTSGADNNAGLFGTVSAAADPADPMGSAIGGTLENIRMTNITVSNISAAIFGSAATGGLAGSVNEGTLQNIRLSNVKVTGSMSGGGTGGMTGEVTGGSKLENVRLINVAVTGSGAATGGMAGAVNGGTVTDCGIYAEETDGVTSAVNYDTHPIDYTGNDKDACIGGLIGSAVETAISKSFAAVKVSGGTVGGFAGSLSGGTVTDCYSGGHTVGGIYDSKDGNVACKIDSGKVGGFAGSIGGTTFAGVCYSSCSLSVKVNNGWSVNIGLFSGEGKSNGGILYTLGEGFDNDGLERTYYNNDDTNVRNISKAPRGDGITAFPYDNMLSGKKYPYQSELTEHYGDWPSGNATVGCFYWEKETENGVGVYHFRLLAWESEDGSEWHVIGGDSNDKRATLIDTLCREYDGNPITEYGYGYFTVAASGLTIRADNDNDNPPDSNLESALLQCIKDKIGRDFTGYLKVTNILNNGGQKEWQAQYKGNTFVTVNFHLDFGAMMATFNGAVNYDGTNPTVHVPSDTSKFGFEEEPYQVRTISQLQHVGKFLDKLFVQGHDLNGYQSAGNNVTIAPVGNQGELTGKYDGRNYRIFDLNIDSEEKCAALFGGLNGEKAVVQNVILYGLHGDATIRSTANGEANVAGITANLYHGAHIENCIVAGYTLVVESSNTSSAWCMGGIAAWMGQTSDWNGNSTRINNCAAVVTLVNKRESGGNVEGSNNTAVCMGGIFGNLSSAATDQIYNCYAGGVIKDESNRKQALIRASGIVGLHQGNNVLTLQNCYSYMTWVGEENKNGNTQLNPIVNCVNPFNASYNVQLNNTCWFGSGMDNNGDTVTLRAVNYDGLNEWFLKNNNVFHPASFINGEQVPDPAPADKDFNGAVVSVPINGAGDVQYVHYGELPKDP